MFPGKSILVASDLTPACEPALRVAGDLALLSGARLHVLHAFELSGNPYAQHQEARVTFQSLVQEAEAGLAEQVRQTIPPEVDVASVKSELYLPWKSIVQRARDVAAELIVLGPHHRVPGDRIMGTTSDRVVRFAEAPCLIVRRAIHFDVSRIVLAIDGSTATEAAWKEAVVWADAIGQRNACTLTVVHCASEWPDVAGGETLVDGAVREARAFLADRDVSVAGEVLRGDDPIVELVGFVDRTDAHLLIMASAGHSAMDRVITGSTVAGVVGRVSCATLVVPYKQPVVGDTSANLYADALAQG
jgi:nucleotide-binding universal stress UspA family protein